MPDAQSSQGETRVVVATWQYEAWRRWFLPTPEQIEARKIAREAERP